MVDTYSTFDLNYVAWFVAKECVKGFFVARLVLLWILPNMT
jgi:hypothetical protein